MKTRLYLFIIFFLAACSDPFMEQVKLLPGNYSGKMSCEYADSFASFDTIFEVFPDPKYDDMIQILGFSVLPNAEDWSFGTGGGCGTQTEIWGSFRFENNTQLKFYYNDLAPASYKKCHFTGMKLSE